MAGKQPNIVVFFWDNFGWGELGCYGGGVLRGAATPRIDKLAGEGLRLLNFNVEAQCTPSRSALPTGRHAIRSGTAVIPVTGGADGLTLWEVTTARALSDAGYATGMWGKWHLGSDPEQRSPVDFGFDEAVWCPRSTDESLWTMPSYFPKGTVEATPYAGALYGLWAGRAVSARRLKGLSGLLVPGSSILIAWADGPVSADTIGALTAPGSQRLILRFNPVEGGAVLEAA